MEFSSPQNKNHCPVYFQNETGLCLWKIVHEWNGHLEVFSRPQVLANPRQYSASPNRYFTKNSRWMPLLDFKAMR